MVYEWLQHIEFKYIWCLPALAALPVIAWLYTRTGRRRTAAFTVTAATASVGKSFKSRLLYLPLILRLLAAAFLIIAIARPQVRNVQTRNKGEGIDIMLCIDVSGSMLSTDFYPNRLEAAKQMAAEFVQQRPVDGIGLVIFSGESYAQVPLSADHETLLEQIGSLQSGMLQDGTLIGEGLATAVGRLLKGRSKSKVVILLTDGKEEAPATRLVDPQTALEIARRSAVKIYTIGMGAGTGTSTEEGSGKEVQGDAGLDEALLRRMAAETGGVYFKAADKEGLQAVYSEIDHLEKSKVEVITKTRFEELAPYFIAVALFFLFIELVVSYTYFRTFP